MSTETPKVRRLLAADLFTLARIISKSTDDLQPRIEDILAKSFSDKNEKFMLIGLAVFESGFRQAAEELQEWLAGMVDPPLSPDDYGKLPLDTPLKMVEIIISQEESTLPDFLERLQGLVQKGQSVFSRTLSSSDTAGQIDTSPDSAESDSGS